MSRARHYAFTLNNYVEGDGATILDTWVYDYVVIGFEVGLNGTPHIQGYVVFKDRVRLPFLKALCARAHWEVARGTPEQNRAYCTKEGLFEERGVLPLTGGQAEHNKWVRVHELARLGDEASFMEEFPDLGYLHPTKFKCLQGFYSPKPVALDSLEHFWYIGAAGSGKSRTARSRFPDAYIKPTGTKWWQGYSGQEVVIIDDLCKTHAYVLEWLKNWADHYPFQAETKGGHTGMIRPKHIVVTTQYHWDEITDDPELRNAIARRFTVTRFGTELGEFDGRFQQAVEDVVELDEELFDGLFDDVAFSQ